MRSGSRFAKTLWYLLLLAGPFSLGAANRPDRRVRSYSGGVGFLTEGSLPDGTCFRIEGSATNREFFADLTRTEEKERVVFRRGSGEVTRFPARLAIVFLLRDQPCSNPVRPPARGNYLSPASIDPLRLSLYWKRGMKLRPAEQTGQTAVAVEPVLPHAKDLAGSLPKRFEWTFRLEVSSRDVPLTDSLVLLFRLPGGWIAARVSARL